MISSHGRSNIYHLFNAFFTFCFSPSVSSASYPRSSDSLGNGRNSLNPKNRKRKLQTVFCRQLNVKGTNIHVGAENVHFEKSGAFTGEISADMLVDLGVEYVIVGHSERRQYFAETDQTVNKRALAALNAGLKVIICVGESLQQREEGVTEELVRMQTKIALRDVTAEQMANVVIAYEPIWAIGTGKTATADQAEEVCGQIRKVIGEVYGEAVAEATTVQYGGSMNAKNCEELLSKKDVDGGLIGGASLKAPDFAVIVNAATKG